MQLGTHSALAFAAPEAYNEAVVSGTYTFHCVYPVALPLEETHANH